MVEFCRYCGHEVTIPQYFGAMRQRIFEYIWKSPGHTAKEITIFFCGRTDSNVVGVHISQIKRELIGTPYRLEETPTSRVPYRTPMKYSIVPSNTERNANANVNVPTVVSRL